jgi:hypothetical protein
MLSESAWAGLEAIGVSVEAIALIAIFGLDLRERRDARKEREEQRKAREDERKERDELRQEREELRRDRARQEHEKQRREVAYRRVLYIDRQDDDALRTELWKEHANRQAGFAVDVDSWQKLPLYLVELVRTERAGQSGLTVHPILRSLVLFTFPEEFGSVLDDLACQELGSSCLVWDRSGRSIPAA